MTTRLAAHRVLRAGSLLLVCVALVAPTRATALNDPLYERQWGLHKVGAKAAWDAGFFGKGVDIAVVDTGVHLTHQDLAANVVGGRNFVTPGKPPQDDESHGTHVAGIAAAIIDNGAAVGVAPHARIIPVKVLDADGGGSTENVAAGIRWAADNGAEIVNLSLTGRLQKLAGPAEPIIDAVRYAWDKGAICVFAAGNDFLFESGFADEPAVVVSSTDSGDGDSDFSNGVGAATWGMAAPGGDDNLPPGSGEGIWSTVWTSDAKTNEYAEKRGTSMAAPFVSGALALLRGAGLSPLAAIERILATAKDLGDPGRDDTFGRGRLDIAKAVEGLPSPGGSTSGAGSGTTAATGGGRLGAPATTAAPATTPRSTSGTRGNPVAPRPSATGVPGSTTAVPGDAPGSPLPTDGVVGLDLEPPDGDEQAGGNGGERSGDREVPLAVAGLAAVLTVASGAGAGVTAAARRRAAR
ncbi:MAG TPA: S8 family serine peptidase [Acidimicrobiales bacterium]